MGAASSSGDCVEGAVKKGDVGHALQIAFGGEGGRESGGDGRAVAGLVQFRDSSGVATEVRTNWGGNLSVGTDSYG